MIVADDWVLYMAPKTGATSLTKAMAEVGLHHHDTKYWHECARIDGKRRYATWRQPRERLVSLWGHGMSSGGRSDDLMEFVRDDILSRKAIPFYSWNQSRWYGHLSLQGIIRTSRLQYDCERILGVDLRIGRHNVSEHVSWRDAFEKWPQVGALLQDWIAEDIALIRSIYAHA